MKDTTKKKYKRCEEFGCMKKGIHQTDINKREILNTNTVRGLLLCDKCYQMYTKARLEMSK